MTVPLSEREERILEEIEKSLRHDDPEFARDVTRRAPHMDQVRKVRVGIALFVSGIVLLIAFFVSQSVIVGLFAFGAMVAGIVTLVGALHVLVTERRPSSNNRRERLQRAFDDWEARLKQRYKRR
ncbi:MAG: hypothetical protein QOC87_1841 [Actinomycetota bacterium]|jgi:hypothetical protein|nr:hypothetical protein [Actinomycetota bacterium]